MKNMFLLIVASVLLVTLGFGQAPAPYSNTDQASIKGCLGGSDGSYTLAEDGTTQTFKIATSTVDLKPHVGHDVEVIGQKTNVAASSGSSDNSVVVTGVNMISEHCATATASASTATASTPAVADTTPTATASTPVVADTTPTATASTPAVADTTPTATASTPAVADTTPAATASAPAVADTTSTATASTPAVAATTPTATASTPAMADTTPATTASAPMMASASEPESTKHLPDTATPLPLLGLLGLGLLATGLLSRSSRTN